MMTTRLRRRLGWLLGLSAAASLLALALAATQFGQRLEWMSYDARMRLARMEATPHRDVALILIDEASLQAMHPVVGRWPWPRSVFADLLEFMALSGARAVLFDVLFSEQQRDPTLPAGALSDQDLFLAQATGMLGRTYHAVQLHPDLADDYNRELLEQPLPEAFRQRFALGGDAGLAERGNNNYLLPLEALYSLSHGIGVVGMEAELDGAYRRLRPFHTYQGDVFPALSVAPLAQPVDAPRPTLGRISGGLALGAQDIPVDADDRLLINLYPLASFQPYSISGVLLSYARLARGEVEDLAVHPDEFRDRIVFIGSSAIGLEDLKETALESGTPGVLLHASVTSNLLKNELLRRAPGWLSPLGAALAALLTGACVLLQPRLALQLGLPPLLAVGFGMAAQALFAAELVVAMVPTLLSLALAWLASLAYLSFTEGRDRKRVRTMLGQYVSPAILAEVVDRYEDHIKAEVGVSEHMTMLFSDIRGFTTLSENLPPRQVVEILNGYFSVMTDVIFRHSGTLDKFIGDAIMAFWGAPIRLPDHADKALLAALDMVDSLRDINHQLRERGLPELRTGIGLHTGEVILGNIGSEKKLDYTVIGDNVNLASRIEGLTSKYACSVLLTEATQRELTTDVPLAVVDAVRVKGKRAPIRIYRPLARPDDSEQIKQEARRLAALTAEGFAAYQQRDWARAIAAYRQLPEDPIRETFLARCRDYRLDEPPPDWDGVHALDSK